MEDDNALVERYISGDAGAMEELVVKYQRQLYAFVYRMTGDVEESKDLTQKAFVNALQGIRGFRKESSFGGVGPLWGERGPSGGGNYISF